MLFSSLSRTILGTLLHIYSTVAYRKDMLPSFKCANITPVPKVKRPNDVSEFIPISLLPTLSKVLEKIVFKKFSILICIPSIRGKMENQCAYIPGIGKDTACHLNLLYNKIV